jgi:aspartate/methionine/tyrosine aminotransferase
MISPELVDLLEPLERFETIRRRVVRLGSRLCDLSYANPYEGVHHQARASLRESLDDERRLDLQYAPFGGQVLSRRAVADTLRSSHQLPFTFNDVVLTPGAMSALHVALRAAGAPGDEVVIPVPCWLDYPLYARATGLTPVTVPLAADGFGLDVDAIADALTARTCAVLLSHPANPTGRNYAAAELDQLAQALAGAERRLSRQLTLIADETHRDFTPEGRYASASAGWERTLVVYSFGKYHFMQGQRLGYVATSPRHPSRETVSAEMIRWTRIAGFATPTALMQRAVPRLLGLRYDQTWLISWRRRIVEELSAVGYSVVSPDATLFVYVRTPDGYDDFEFASELASEGVLVLPAPVFHHRGYFRLALTGSEPMLEGSLTVFKRFAPGQP